MRWHTGNDSRGRLPWLGKSATKALHPSEESLETTSLNRCSCEQRPRQEDESCRCQSPWAMPSR